MKYLIFKIVFILLVIACLAICTYVNLADRAAAIGTAPAAEVTASPTPDVPAKGVIETSVPVIVGVLPEPEPQPQPQPITAEDWYGVAPEDLEERLQGLYIPTVAEVDRVTKMMPGEFNSPSITERAQPVWTALNRIDSDDRDFKSIKTLTKAITPGAFHGYRSNRAVRSEYRDLAIDVITRWLNEKLGFEDIGRVLPAEYLFFEGTGKHNIYRTTWRSSNPECKFYDNSLPSPYES